MLAIDLVRHGAARHADRIAVRFDETALTFAEVDAMSGALAAVLAERLPPGSPVALLTNNGPHSLSLDFASLKARTIRVPLNARLAEAEHRVMLERIGARLLIHAPELTERAQALAAAIPGLEAVTLDTLLAAADPARDGDFCRDIRADDIITAIYTSGTTGTLKAVQHSQTSFGAIAGNVLANLVDPRPCDAMLHAAPLIHASGTFVLPYWVRGGTTAILPGFVPTDFLAAVERWRPNALMLVPTMLAMLFETPGFDPAMLDSVDTILYGASPMPRPLIARALDMLGPRFVQFYGQTEAPLAITVLTKEDHLDPARLLACGRPARECELRLIDADGNDVAPGTPGEIVLRAPFRMVGYHDAPDLNAETLPPDGWLRTRDIGVFDADGYLTLVDRTSDMIVSGGYNVYPKEVEDALLAHPAVREAAVVGLPHDNWGEQVAAFVVLRSEAAVDADALTEHCRAHLAGYKLPRVVHFIDEVPKSAVGKPLRRVLREPFWQGRERRI